MWLSRRRVGWWETSAPVVGVPGCIVDDGRHDHPVRGTVAPEAIGDETAGDTAAPLEQLAKEPHGGVAIPAGLEQDVDDLAVLVDGPPEVLTLATNRHEQFLEMPRVTDRSGPMPEPPGVREAEGLAPVPNGFVRDGDAAVGPRAWERTGKRDGRYPRANSPMGVRHPGGDVQRATMSRWSHLKR